MNKEQEQMNVEEIVKEAKNRFEDMPNPDTYLLLLQIQMLEHLVNAVWALEATVIERTNKYES